MAVHTHNWRSRDGGSTLPVPGVSATVACVSSREPREDVVVERCTTPDGLGIAVYDFGGSGPDLLLVHATGFCADVLRPLAGSLAPAFHCRAIDLRGHGRSDRPADGSFAWSGFALDVLAAVDHLGLHAPFGFGHSCGGASLLLAEEARPGAFRSLYCFEPVVVPDVPGLPPTEGDILAIGARRRRETFPSAEDAFVNFSAKPSFGAFEPEALRWYVESGFEVVPAAEGGDGRSVRLRCRRDDEAEIYANGAAHDAFARFPEIRCHVSLACGERTDAFGSALLEADAARLRSASIEVLPGLGHFGPLQDPSAVAASVVRHLVPAEETAPS